MNQFPCQTLVELFYRIFIMLNNNFGEQTATFIMWFLILTETRFHINECNIKDHIDLCQYCLIYLLLTVTWLFLLRTRFVSQRKSFVMYWLKSLFLVYLNPDLKQFNTQTLNTQTFNTQTILRQIANELFECDWPFCGIGV